MPNCRKCKIELSWPQPYVKGARPVNQDGTSHDCGPVGKPKSGRLAPALNPPEDAQYGNYRCGACKYNNAAYCSLSDKFAHQMRI